MYPIEIRNLSKRFGKVSALNDVSLSVEPGALMGVVGVKNAGKTTLLRILATALQPTSGEIFIDDMPLKNLSQLRGMIGYMPSDLGIYSDLTVFEYLDFFAACYHVPSEDRSTLIGDLLQLTDLHHRSNDWVERLTPGMKKRLSLARVLIHDPSILLLDEPLAGIDPKACVETRNLISELHDMGKTIIITAESSLELKDLCTDIILIEAGKVVGQGILDTVGLNIPNYRVINIKFLGDVDRATAIAQNAVGVVSATHVQPYTNTALPTHTTLNLLKELRVTFEGSYDDASALLRKLMHSGTQVVSFGEIITKPINQPIEPEQDEIKSEQTQTQRADL